MHPSVEISHVVGPLLFLIYANDLNLNLLHCETKLYADNTVLYLSFSSLAEAHNKMSEDLKIFEHWCMLSQVTINGKKIKGNAFFNCSRRDANNNLPYFPIGGMTIDYVDHYVYLGMKLDIHLMYNLQLAETTRITGHKMYLLSLIRKCILQCHHGHLQTKILTYFDYGDIFFHDTNQSVLTKLQRLQNRALRICLKKNTKV